MPTARVIARLLKEVGPQRKYMIVACVCGTLGHLAATFLPVFGIAAAFGLTWLITMLAAVFGLPLAYPIWMCVAVSSLLMIIALMSGVLSLGMLKQSQPADLLR